MVRLPEDPPVRPSSGQRVPPHNLQAEESLLGAMLLNPEAVAAATEVGLTHEDFYRPAHAHIYDAICGLYAAGEPVDPVTVSDELTRNHFLEMVGGPGALLTLQANTPATSNASRYARIVDEHALLRKLIAVAGEMAEMAYGLPEDVTGALDRAESMVFEIAERKVSNSTAKIADLLSQTLDRLEALATRGDSVTGVPTGYFDLDELTSGLQPSTLVIVGARPSMGKTAFALGMTANAALKHNVPTLFFSLEMGHIELTQRLLCSEARVDSSRVRNGNLTSEEWSKISHAVGRLAEAPIFIDDNPNVTVMDIRAKARRLKAQENLGMIVIDYVQLMSGRSSAENRQVEVAEISRSLKVLARELEIPIVALCQLNRGLETRQDKRPMLADLRESGSLEQDADIVMFLYRDEVYNHDTAEKGKAEVIVSKHRNGPIDKIDLAFLNHYTRFENLARSGGDL